MIGAASIIVGGYFMSSLVTYNNTLVIKDESQIDDYGVMGAEYLPTAVSMSLLTTDGLSHSEAIKVNSYLKRGITVQLNLINNSNESQNISVPLIYYFGYKAKDLSTKKSLEIISGEKQGKMVSMEERFYLFDLPQSEQYYREENGIGN